MERPGYFLHHRRLQCGDGLEPAIASALAQHGVTVEVLVVDDCSRDDTTARVAALAQSGIRASC